MKKGSKQRRITYTYAPDEHLIKVSFIPALQSGNPTLKHDHLNGLINGTAQALHILLHDLPMLRAPTEEEENAHVYIFKDKIKDNAIFKTRKVLYTDIVSAFNDILSKLFGDVVYIDAALAYQQSIVLEMTPEEAEAHRVKIDEIAKHVIASTDTGIQMGSDLMDEPTERDHDDDGGFDPAIG